MIKLSSLSNKVLQYGFVFLLVILLAGCTKKFLYSNIDWFVIEYLDDYVSRVRISHSPPHSKGLIYQAFFLIC
ncbi:hypothetical protein P3394_20015, partial [Vibrio parahaemolyticus]|nr:hypothetical protein [Vibrio parahaemolyticus]MDG3428736.1 hypothetical protein [Vibrio parahaemolyticus]